MGDSDDARRVGLIGVGLLGSALAERMMASGFRVVGYDTDESCRETIAALGGDVARCAADVIRKCPRIVLSLPDSDVVAQVVADVEDSLRPQQTIIDTTTGDPRVTESLDRQFQRRGVAFLDATIGGSSAQTRRGEVVAMVGGLLETFEANRDILDSIAANVVHLGPCGSGARMKLVVNLVLGLHRAVLAEALTFGESCGLHAEQILEVLKNSPANSSVTDTKGMKMIRRDFSPQARLRQHFKDVSLILELGSVNDAHLPLTRLHSGMLHSLITQGFGNEDNSAVMRAFLRDEPRRE